MTQVDTLEDAEGASRAGLVGWLRAKDPDFLVVKRSVRAAIVIPAIFAIAHTYFSSPQVGLFAAFGSFSMLLLVEFTGPVRTRVVSYLSMFAVCAALIAVGTAVSTNKVGAVVAMGVVGFLVLFAGIVAPRAATASTAILLNFVLPVAVAQPASAIGDRLLGWSLAGAASIGACLLLWPPPWHDNLRRRLSAAADAIGRLTRAQARGDADPSLHTEVRDELARLRTQFSATAYPPTGAASSAIALSKLVGRIEWVGSLSALLSDDHVLSDPRFSGERAEARAVIEASAETLREAAGLICDGEAHPVDDPARIAALQEATRRLDALIEFELNADVATVVQEESALLSPEEGGQPDGSFAGSSLDPGLHARGLGVAVGMVADAALESAGAVPVSDRRRSMPGAWSAHHAGHRLLSHLSFRSVWFRNSVRGAAGLALAVAVVEITNVSHGFWVVLGTMSVLRSNALGTGATALRAIGGTAIGFVVGSAIMLGIADHTVLLWVLLPLAVLVAGMAPSMISFVAGQAGFTLVVIILFNIIQPAGWKVGLTRIEDVAIGCGVSVVVGLLFWPRGATAALGRALSDSFVTSSAYLADAVNRLTMTSRFVDVGPNEREAYRAYLLLDDATRQFFAERGAKVVSIETVARLFTGSNRLRLAAYTLGTLRVEPPADGLPEVEAIAVAEAVLRDSYAETHDWYQEFANLLADRRNELTLPSPQTETLHHVLRRAFDEVRARQRPDRVHTALQMLWVDELLEGQSSMQADLLASADLFRRRRRALLI
ncbi:MAG TPA: FUSC family protein [Acidimicrobiales bacterium]|jgi:uncharacterized membrane protein YccC|nr:FUSC family protein [Acidimicrobiales bacterium]